jgi:NarL family two-component system response regulator LiaR
MDPMNEKIRVVIADDNLHQVLGLVELLGYSDEIEVVGKANTAQQAVSLVQNLKPNVILLDMIWYKNEQEGLAAIRQIRESAPDTRILAMTAYDDVIEKARQAGADRAIHKDYLYSMAAMVEHIKATDEARRLPVVAQSPLEKLSKREQEALEWMCDGLSDKEIAVQLVIQPNTVKKFNANIYRKLGVSGRGEAISLAIRNGLVKPKDDKDKYKKE